MEQSIAAIVLMVASGVSAGAEPATGTEVYRWKDAAGLVHYSDTPPTVGTFIRVRLASSLATTVDGSAPRSVGATKSTSAERVMDTSAVGGVDGARDIAGDGAHAVEPGASVQEGSAFARRNCTEAREQLQYVERRATEKPSDDPHRASSRELENAYQLRLTAYNHYQTARDAQLVRVGRYCAE